MENASKALLIAAAILIVIVLIGFGVSVLNSGSEAIKQGENVGNSISLAGKDAADKVGSILDRLGGGSVSLDHSGVVPVGGEYNSGGTTYEPGDTMPTLQNNATYTYGDYIYTYDSSRNCWNVKVRDNTRDKYGEILNNINGKEIGIMERTFKNCSNLTTNVPEIPSTVKHLIYTFDGCTNLKVMPKIPYGVVEMIGTFKTCANLSEVKAIPDSVGNMIQCFYGCSSIESITIPKSVTSIGQTFVGCNSLTSITIKKSEGSLNLDTPIPSGLTNAQKACIVWAP